MMILLLFHWPSFETIKTQNTSMRSYTMSICLSCTYSDEWGGYGGGDWYTTGVLQRITQFFSRTAVVIQDVFMLGTKLQPASFISIPTDSGCHGNLFSHYAAPKPQAAFHNTASKSVKPPTS